MSKTPQPSFDSFFKSNAYQPVNKTEVYRPKTIIEREKEKIREQTQKEMEKYSHEEWREIIAKKYYNRKYLGWPCDIAQAISVGNERLSHIKTCKECEKCILKLINSGLNVSTSKFEEAYEKGLTIINERMFLRLVGEEI